jgi:hypothetical protein
MRFPLLHKVGNRGILVMQMRSFAVKLLRLSGSARGVLKFLYRACLESELEFPVVQVYLKEDRLSFLSSRLTC